MAGEESRRRPHPDDSIKTIVTALKIMAVLHCEPTDGRIKSMKILLNGSFQKNSYDFQSDIRGRR